MNGELFVDLSPLKKAEEVYLIVRELSKKNSGMFLWKTWHDACSAVLAPIGYATRNGFKMTVGNMLRAQVKHGTIERTSRGVYRMRELEPRRPLYITASQFNMRRKIA